MSSWRRVLDNVDLYVHVAPKPVAIESQFEISSKTFRKLEPNALISLD